MDFGQNLMLAADAARAIGCSASAVVLYADSGRLRLLGRTVRGVRVFVRSDVEDFAARFRETSTTPLGPGGYKRHEP